MAMHPCPYFYAMMLRRTFLSSGLAVCLPLALGAVLFTALGANPVQAFEVMIEGAFGSWNRLSETLIKASPLVFTGLAVAIPARMNLWNIGAEGQLVMGAVFASASALFIAPVLPDALGLPVIFVAGAVGGMAWALGPALLRAKIGVNEIITTLLLNYVAIALMEHLFYGPWRDPKGFGFPGTAMFAEAFRLDRYLGSRIHIGLLVCLVAALSLYLVLKLTKWGFEIRVVGLSPKAAAYAGMPVATRIVSVLLISGALAGAAGMFEVCGIHYRLQQGVAAGYGYDGIIAACLARFHPLAIPPAALLLGVLIVGGDYLQTRLHLPSSISLVLEAAVLLSLLAGDYVNRLAVESAAKREVA
ncbi:ABC transporter permease [Desulfovibrio inopinatus]|uniref:ABC transporter permease n=1 Tax=Desulfovibrio inopinatus TaxID=102109 RepID=UPI001FE1B059|nr:ABC transporter permease [Desulfovibrio inopinatus]